MDSVHASDEPESTKGAASSISLPGLGYQGLAMAVEYSFRGTTLKDRRKDRRFPVCLPALADGAAAIITNISLGGCAFVAEDADLDVSDVISIIIDGHIKLEATILRRWSRDHYAGAFVGLTPAAFRAIENLETGHARRHGASKTP